MSDRNRKALIRKYKETPRPAGIFRIRNSATGKSLIGSTVDIAGMLNRQRFQLENGSHPDKELQADWNEFGPDAFEFETLDRLSPSDKPDYDPTEDLAVLEKMWIDTLTASGEMLYRSAKRDA